MHLLNCIIKLILFENIKVLIPINILQSIYLNEKNEEL